MMEYWNNEAPDGRNARNWVRFAHSPLAPRPRAPRPTRRRRKLGLFVHAGVAANWLRFARLPRVPRAWDLAPPGVRRELGLFGAFAPRPPSRRPRPTRPCREIGFVFSHDLAGRIRHNHFLIKHLPSLAPLRKLGLFRTIRPGGRARPALPATGRNPKGLAQRRRARRAERSKRECIARSGARGVSNSASLRLRARYNSCCLLSNHKS